MVLFLIYLLIIGENLVEYPGKLTVSIDGKRFLPTERLLNER
jgi:hypothetical protein